MKALSYPRFVEFRQEMALTWRFVFYDISSTIMPAMLFLVAALHASNLSLISTLIFIARGLTYFFLYIYVFCLSNQLTGIEEDRINKPDRPLPMGIVTVRGTQIRFIIGMAFFTLVGWLFGVVEWALLWQVSLIVNNLTSFGKSWLTKHLNITVGTFAMMAAAWQIVTPITPLAFAWIAVTSLIVFPLIAVQDLRDIDGDRAIGRKTLPIILGENTTRILITVCFLIAPVLTHIYMVQPAGLTGASILCELLLTGICLTIAIRTITLRTQAADHRTYMLFTYWYCALLASAIIIIR